MAEWVRVIRLLAEGTSAYALARRLGRPYKGIRRAVRKLREAVRRKPSLERKLWDTVRRQGAL